jgi:hypothetical protein
MSTGKCGWVLKEGEKVTNWKKRYLCIEQEAGKMSYYIKDNKKEKKGEILLKTIKDVRTEKEYKGKRLVFGIHTTVGRIYYIQGSDEDNVASWVNAIKEAINPTPKPVQNQQQSQLNSNPKPLVGQQQQTQQQQPQQQQRTQGQPQQQYQQTQQQQQLQQQPRQYSEEDFIQLKVIGRGGFGKVLLVRKKDSGQVFLFLIYCLLFYLPFLFSVFLFATGLCYENFKERSYRCTWRN